MIISKTKFLVGILLFMATIATYVNCTKKKEDNTSTLAILGLASRASSGSGVNNGSAPFDSDAAAAGYTVPNVPVKGVSALSLADSGTSLQVRNNLIAATKVDNNLTSSARYTPTSTTSLTNGTCEWKYTQSGVAGAFCIYPYSEGACAGLSSGSPGITSTFTDFTTDTSSATCTSRGYTNCTSISSSGVSFTQCAAPATTTTTGTTGTTGTTAPPTSYLFNTTSGVVSYGFALQPSEIGTSNFTVQATVNGQTSDVNFSATGARTTNRLVLNSGRNYVWLTINSGGTPIARSNVYRLDSTVASSVLRTELSWSGTGDVDLHLDNGSGSKHVYWNSKTYTGTGENIALDVDNTVAYGPENIRVFTAPTGTLYRFYANYYSGASNLTLTAKVFIGTTLLETKTLSFTSSDANASSTYNAKSKLIGTYTVTGEATATTTIVAPASLTYTGSPYSFARNTAITTQTPTLSGTPTSCTANPTLPTGLTISATTCAISGTPTTNQAATSYTITASNSAGSTTATISIAIGFTVTLNLDHSSATGANKFTAIILNSSGLKLGGIASSTTLTASKTYSGNFKSVDSTTVGVYSSTDATVDNGTYSLLIYSDSDGSNTVNIAGDKVYSGTITVNGSNTTATVSNASLVAPVDLDIQYSGGALTAYNGKSVLCYIFGPGIGATIVSASTFTNARIHNASLAMSAINAGSFSGASKATVTNLLGSVGTGWLNGGFAPSGTPADIACYVDNNVNATPDVGEPYLKGTGLIGATITVTSSGTLP